MTIEDRLKPIPDAYAEIGRLRAENERLKARGIERMQCRIAELAAALGPFAAGAEHLPPWAKDDAFVNIDFPYTSDGDFGERWLIDDREIGRAHV